MKFTPEVVAALKVLRDNAESDFERHRIDVLERDFTSPPTVEVVDEHHQRFLGVLHRAIKDKHYTSTIKLHRAVYEYFNGEIPAGCVIHHIDGNASNNNADNLQLMTRAEHAKIHADISGTVPPPHKKIVLTCINCGRVFTIRQEQNSGFCSSTCRMSYRFRNLRETRICQRCGKEFETYKYGTARFCSKECSHPSEKTIKKICPVCGKEFSTIPSQNNTCCSHKCASTLMWKTSRTDDKAKHKTCEACGADFIVKKPTQRFCSKSCAMKHRNRKD